MIRNLLIAIALILLLFSCMKEPSQAEDCPFCNPEILQRQTFYEKNNILALYTHKPITQSHFLIIPKRHVERYEDLTAKEILEIHSVIQKVHAAASESFGTSSYLLLQKNGKEVGQSVPHLHFHYIARKQNDSSILKLFLKFVITPLKKPIPASEMEKVIQKLSENNRFAD